MKQDKVFWVCPECEELNPWEQSSCKKCSAVITNLLNNTNRFHLSHLSIPVVHRGNTFYFRRQRTRNVVEGGLHWDDAMRELRVIARDNDLQITTLMRSYKRLKQTGLTDSEIVTKLNEEL